MSDRMLTGVVFSGGRRGEIFSAPVSRVYLLDPPPSPDLEELEITSDIISSAKVYKFVQIDILSRTYGFWVEAGRSMPEHHEFIELLFDTNPDVVRAAILQG